MRRHHLGDRGVDGRIILKWVFKMWGWGMDWFDLPQDRDRWQAGYIYSDIKNTLYM